MLLVLFLILFYRYYWSVHPACLEMFKMGNFCRKEAKKRVKMVEHRQKMEALAAASQNLIMRPHFQPFPGHIQDLQHPGAIQRPGYPGAIQRPGYPGVIHGVPPHSALPRPTMHHQQTIMPYNNGRHPMQEVHNLQLQLQRQQGLNKNRMPSEQTGIAQVLQHGRPQPSATRGPHYHPYQRPQPQMPSMQAPRHHAVPPRGVIKPDRKLLEMEAPPPNVTVNSLGLFVRTKQNPPL